MKKAFTLMEMLIAVTILSLITIFLYRTFASLAHSNDFYAKELALTSHEQKVANTLYLDLTLGIPASLKLININKNSDVLLMQSKHSIHRQIKPYIAYIIKENHLWRIEASEPLSYPLSEETQMLIDDLGEASVFRAYQKDNATLVHLEQKEMLLLRANLLDDVADF